MGLLFRYLDFIGFIDLCVFFSFVCTLLLLICCSTYLMWVCVKALFVSNMSLGGIVFFPNSTRMWWNIIFPQYVYTHRGKNVIFIWSSPYAIYHKKLIHLRLCSGDRWSQMQETQRKSSKQIFLTRHDAKSNQLNKRWKLKTKWDDILK